MMSQQKPVVLVVDDDPETVKIFEYFLSRQGYTSYVAHTVNEALARIEEVIPDIVLLDVMLPERNGTDLLKHIRSTPSLANIYVIVISAHVIDERHLPTGIMPDETLQKPIRIPHLEAAIKHGLR